MMDTLQFRNLGKKPHMLDLANNAIGLRSRNAWTVAPEALLTQMEIEAWNLIDFGEMCEGRGSKEETIYETLFLFTVRRRPFQNTKQTSENDMLHYLTEPTPSPIYSHDLIVALTFDLIPNGSIFRTKRGWGSCETRAI